MIAHEHALHRRRWTRNLGLGLLLAAFVGLVYGLTIVKVSRLGPGAISAIEGPQGLMPAPGQETAP